MNKTLLAAILATVVVSPAFAGNFAADELLFVRAKGFGSPAVARSGAVATTQAESGRLSQARAEAATYFGAEDVLFARAKGHIN